MPKYIEVTQDGCARLIRGVTPADIEGIYTDGLLTCIAIIIVGANGVALIHDTGSLSVASILREFDAVGQILYWTIAFNPEYYPGGKDNENLQRKNSRFIEEVEEKIGREKHLKVSPRDIHIKLFEAKKTFVSISLRGRVDVDARPADIIPPRNVDERHHLINVVNNYFLEEEEKLDADLQFDGSNFTDISRLKKTHEEIVWLCRVKPRFYNRNGFSRVMETHRSADAFIRLLNKYKSSEGVLPSLAVAIINSSKEDQVTLRKIQLNVETLKLIDEIFPKYELRGVPDSEKIERALVLARAVNHVRDVQFLEYQIEKKKLEAVLAKYKGDDGELPEPELALRRAAHENHLEDLQFLIQKVSDINAQDNNPNRRKTALHWAVIKGRKENVSALLAAGAKDDIPDAAGKTANNYAMQSADEEMKSLFQSHASATFSH